MLLFRLSVATSTGSTWVKTDFGEDAEKIKNNGESGGFENSSCWGLA